MSPDAEPSGAQSGRGSPPRAGILVTGTEVLTGIISDRNGPWLSERLREIGVDAAMIQIVGDRPEDLLAALRFMRDDGMALIITSGGLGPTADDLTAEIVGRFCGRPMVLDAALEARIAEILRPMIERWPNLDADAIRLSNRKQAVIPEGATVLEPEGTAPGLVVPPLRRAGLGADGGRAAGAAPGAAADVGDGPCDGGVRRRHRRRDRIPPGDHPPVRHPRVRDRQHPAGGAGRRRAAVGAGDHHLPAPRRDRDRHALRARRPARLRRAARVHPPPPRRHALLARRLHDRRPGGGDAGRPHARGGRVVYRRLAWRPGSPTGRVPRPTSSAAGWCTPTPPRSTSPTSTRA